MDLFKPLKNSLFTFLCIVLMSNAYAKTLKPTDIWIVMANEKIPAAEQQTRIQTAQLLLHLLPDHVRVKVWVYDKNLRLIGQTDKLTAIWRGRTAERLGKVPFVRKVVRLDRAFHALDRAWGRAQFGRKLQMIIISNGWIHAGEEPQHNWQLREAFRAALPTLLDHRSIHVDSIIIGENQDLPLLKAISVHSDGDVAQYKDLSEIYYKFNREFKTDKNKQRLKAIDGKFIVDYSIDSFALIVLRKAPEEAQIILENQAETQYTFRNKPDNMTWIHGDLFDFIAVDTPTRGQWQLYNNAAGKVALYANSTRRLAVQLPDEVYYQYETLPAKITLNGRTDAKTLALTTQWFAKDKKLVKTDRFKALRHDGIYQATHPFYVDLKPGRYAIQTRAENTNVNRWHESYITVKAFPFAVSEIEPLNMDGFQIKISLKNPGIDPKKIHLKADILKNNQWQALKIRDTTAGEWVLIIDEVMQEQKYPIKLHVEWLDAKRTVRLMRNDLDIKIPTVLQHSKTLAVDVLSSVQKLHAYHNEVSDLQKSVVKIQQKYEKYRINWIPLLVIFLLFLGCAILLIALLKKKRIQRLADMNRRLEGER